MAINTRHTDERIDTEPDLGSYGVPRIGTDAAGDVHYYDDANDRILVTREGDVVHVEALDGRPVADWMGYVGAERGWDLTGTDSWLATIRPLADAVEEDA